MYAAIFYSHSDYSDVWPAMFGQTDKYLPGVRKYLFSDQSTPELHREGWEIIRYDDTMRYQQRMTHCLDLVEEDIVLFHHEDMFLYQEPKREVLDEFIELIEEGEVDIVKLIRASYSEHRSAKVTSSEFIYENPQDLQFAIQPSLCDKEKLRLIYDKTSGDNIWEFESNSSAISSYFKIKTGMVYTESDIKRGQFHWDSSIYPYIATAVVKGRWNFSDYSKELPPILEEYSIDYEKRGIC
jgi:hypothetical protein